MPAWQVVLKPCGYCVLPALLGSSMPMLHPCAGHVILVVSCLRLLCSVHLVAQEPPKHRNLDSLDRAAELNKIGALRHEASEAQ
jgi:hypothetical protein